MATPKRTHSHKRRSRFLRFSEVKGKIIEAVEIDPDVQAIAIVFSDKTSLTFELDPALIVFPQLSGWRTGDWKSIRQWPALHSKTAMVEWP